MFPVLSEKSRQCGVSLSAARKLRAKVDSQRTTSWAGLCFKLGRLFLPLNITPLLCHISLQLVLFFLVCRLFLFPFHRSLWENGGGQHAGLLGSVVATRPCVSGTWRTCTCLRCPPRLCPEAPHLLSIASMVSTRGTSRISARKQTASPARIEGAPKPTGGRTAQNSPSMVSSGAARPPSRALTEAKPIPICLSEQGLRVSRCGLDARRAWRAGSWVLGAEQDRERVLLQQAQQAPAWSEDLQVWGQHPCVPPHLPPGPHLISVGYSSPVNRYTQMKELARQPFPSAAWAVRRLCISGGQEDRVAGGAQSPKGEQGGTAGWGWRGRESWGGGWMRLRTCRGRRRQSPGGSSFGCRTWRGGWGGFYLQGPRSLHTTLLCPLPPSL